MPLNITASAIAKRKRNLDMDSQLQLLLGKTPQELDEWINANVNSLEDVKFVMKRLLRLVIYVVKKIN